MKGGRCEACQGDGLIKIEMHFLPDVYVTCEVCKGQRYNRETMEIHHKGQQHRRHVEYDGRRCVGVLRAHSVHQDEAADACTMSGCTT